MLDVSRSHTCLSWLWKGSWAQTATVKRCLKTVSLNIPGLQRSNGGRSKSLHCEERSQQTVNRLRFRLWHTHTHTHTHSVYFAASHQHQSVPLLYWDTVCLYLFTAHCVSLCSEQLSAQLTEIYCFAFPLLSSPPSSTCNNIQLPHMNVLMSECSSSTSKHHAFKLKV